MIGGNRGKGAQHLGDDSVHGHDDDAAAAAVAVDDDDDDDDVVIDGKTNGKGIWFGRCPESRPKVIGSRNESRVDECKARLVLLKRQRK